MIKTQKNKLKLLQPRDTNRQSRDRDKGSELSVSGDSKQNLSGSGSGTMDRGYGVCKTARDGRNLGDWEVKRSSGSSGRAGMNRTCLLYGERIEEVEDEGSQDRSKSKSISKSIKSQKNLKPQPQAQLSLTQKKLSPSHPQPHNPRISSFSPLDRRKNYNYTHNISKSPEIEIEKSQCANKKSREISYQLQGQHIEMMHREIGDLLRAINRSKGRHKGGQGEGREEREEKGLWEMRQQQDRQSSRAHRIDQTSKGKSNNYYKQYLQPLKTQTTQPNPPNTQMQESLVNEYKDPSPSLSSCLPSSTGNDREIYNDFLHRYRKLKEETGLVRNAGSSREMSREAGYCYGDRERERWDEEEERVETGRWHGQDYEEPNSEYIENIDKEISKIKQRILNSQRVTKDMQTKYLAKGNETPEKYSAYPSKQYFNEPHTHPRQPSAKSSRANSKAPHEKVATSRGGEELVKRLALAFAGQVEMDVKMRPWREYLGRWGEGEEVWLELSKKIGKLGFSYTEDELRYLLEINSTQSNPFNPPNTPTPNPPLPKLLDALCTTFTQSEHHWYQYILSSLKPSEAQAHRFSIQALDLNRKGYICLQDIVCFVNLYAGRFYRNRDFVPVWRRLVARGQGLGLGKGLGQGEKRIGYQLVEEVLFDWS